MKTVFLSALLLFSSSLFANSFETLLSISTEDSVAQVFGETVESPGCLYEVVKEIWDGEEPVVALYINGQDQEQRAAFKISLPLHALPLQEGVEYSRYSNSSIRYQDGVLRYYFKDVSAQYFGLSKDIEEIKLEVDPNLQNVKSAYGNAFTRRYLLPNVPEKKLQCRF